MGLGVSVRTSVVSARKERRHPDYPLPALQQLTRNAVMHRTYEGTNAPVRVYWYNDRIEIQSPGGLYGRVTPQNIWNGVTDYRNPLVAEIMHHLGYVQRFGLGLPLTQQSLRENGNPPAEFGFQSSGILVTLRPSL
jgi:ATP-dependent DNA helicase RecG